MKIPLFFKHVANQACISLVAFMMVVSFPSNANAGFFSTLGNLLGIETEASEPESSDFNSQNIPLLEPNITPELKNGKNEIAINIVDDGALEANTGPAGTEADVDNAASSSDPITVYIVREKDTLDSIAKANKTSKQAIIYANSDISRADLVTPGQTLIIFPIKGVVYKVKKGDSLENLAKKYKVSSADILEYNLMGSSKDLKVGQEILLPGITKLPQEKVISIPNGKKVSTKNTSAGIITSGYIWPFPAGAGRVSQGRHDGQAYDFSAPVGTPIYAIKGGIILTVKASGYNGGYGKYVVMNFDNGAQAIFAHMSAVATSAGQIVSQGDIIGYVGSTGRSTGPHVHIEFRGGWANPYNGLPKSARGL